MQFSNFTRSEEGNTIKFYTAHPLYDIVDIKYFSDNSSGPFSKKEFRWSFNGDYWSSWETLNQGNISGVSIGGNKYLFLEIRYISSGGTVTSFILNYDGPAQTEYTGQSCPPDASYAGIDKSVVDQYTPGSAPPSGGSVDADTLCGKSCDYYLWRPNHKGEQPISSITDLQRVLNGLSASSQNGITGASNVPGGIGTFYEKDGKNLIFKSIDSSGTGIDILEKDGVIYLSVDASITYNDASLNQLWTDFYDLSIYIDSTFVNIYNQFQSVDSSIVRLDASVNYLFSVLSDNSINGFQNIGGGSGEIYRDISSMGVVQLRTIDGSGGTTVTTSGNKIIIESDLTPDVSVKDIKNVGSGTGEIFKTIDGSGAAEMRRIVGAGDVSISTAGDDVVIFIDADVSVNPVIWTDTDPISADVGGLVSGDVILPGSNSVDILEDILYEYFPPSGYLTIDPCPGPTSLNGYYEKWLAAESGQEFSNGASYTYRFNNDDFSKLRIFDVSVYVNGVGFAKDSWGGTQDTGVRTIYDSLATPVSTYQDLIVNTEIENKVDGNTMTPYDVSTTAFFVEPYFYGVVQDSVNYQNVSQSDITALNKLIVPEQTNLIPFDVSANYVKLKFLYAYPATYNDVTSIFDVKNDFNVTTSFDTSIINMQPSPSAPVTSYKVYIKSHWISFTPDVSIFKLIFNI